MHKIYLDNTNLIFSLVKENQNIVNVRETFFMNQVRVNNNLVASNITDFKIDSMEFEVGGKDKKKKQIKLADQGYIVKDNIESGFLNTIPLWHFGLLY